MLKKSNQKGFTIIEVLIVLAIAGLIMLIVFLAVPALQRNSRNTQRKNDASAYMGAVSEWMNNNNGKVPSTAADVAAINSLAKLNTLTPPTGIPPTGAQTSVVGVDTMQLVTIAKCDATIGNTTGGSARGFAIRYATETTGTAAPQCIEG